MVGDVAVGGGAPISVQSMTTTKTADVEGTLRQIYALAAAGADIVRCTCNDRRSRRGPGPHRAPLAGAHRRRHPPPVQVALAALEAGVPACASTRATSASPSTSRRWPRGLQGPAASPSASGSTAARSTRAVREVRRSGHPRGHGRVGSAASSRYFDEVGFDDVKISVKASNVPLMIEAYRQLAEVDGLTRCTWGSPRPDRCPAGCSRPPPASPRCCAEGIGDTIRYSLTADPVEEARAGRQLLEALGLRERKGLDLIACPSCGRAEIDVIDVGRGGPGGLRASAAIPIQVAVMGCVVNGPGEAREADLGIAAGRHRGHLFVKGQNVAVVRRGRDGATHWSSGPSSSHEHGVEAALARGRHRGGGRGRGRPGRAARRAGRPTPTRSEQQVELIRKH